MKRIIFLLIIFMNLLGCVEKKSSDFWGDISDKEKIELKIINKLAENLEKEKKLHFCAIGSENKKDYWVRSLGFQYFDVLTIDEMRKLLIYLTKLFIENFNASEEFLSYVKTPYEVKNFEISVFLRDKKGWDIPPPNIIIGELRDEQITYYVRENDKLKEVYEETYEEALKKVEK